MAYGEHGYPPISKVLAIQKLAGQHLQWLSWCINEATKIEQQNIVRG